MPEKSVPAPFGALPAHFLRGPEKKQKIRIFLFSNFPVHAKKIAWDGPKRGREVIFPANPNLADIFGDTDFDFENLYFLDLFGSQISGLGPPI